MSVDSPNVVLEGALPSRPMNTKVDLREAALQRLASNNPIATTAVFKHLLANVQTNLIGMSTARLTNESIEARPRRGLWGMNTCHRAVVECNDRASQHIHGMLHGGLTPALVADVAADGGIVREVVGELLPNVSADASLKDAGLTKHLAVELRKRLVARLGVLGHTVELPNVLDDHLTIHQLEEHLDATMPKDAPPAVGLRQQAMHALDTQVQGGLPLVYHAVYVAQRVLRVAARRDVAHDVPTPPPTDEEWESRKEYAELRRVNNDYTAFLKEWATAFHSRHHSADVFARIANGCKGERRGRAMYDRLDYKACRDEIWWPTFEHHAHIVVLNRHSHEHCKSCTKTARGKVGCRFCACWPHGVERTRCIQLLPKEIFPETDTDTGTDTDPDASGGAHVQPVTDTDRGTVTDTDTGTDADTGDVSMSDSPHADGEVAGTTPIVCVPRTRGNGPCRCMVCFADGAWHAAQTKSGKDRDNAIGVVAKEDRLRDLYYDEVEPAEDPRAEEPSSVDPEAVDAGSGVMAPYADAAPADLDERILAVEIARPLIPAADEQRYCRTCGRLLFLCTCSEELGGAAGRARLDELTADLERRHTAPDTQYICMAVDEDATQETARFNFACVHGCQCAAKLADDGVDAAVHEMARLVEAATTERRPCPFLPEGVVDSAKRDPLAVEHIGHVAAARTVLRQLVAPGQPLRKVLHSGDCCELRNTIYGLAEEPLPEPAEAAAAEAYRRKESERATALFDLLTEWTWSPSGVKMACRNGLIADYNIAMAGCVRGNAVPYSLGAGAGSKAGSMYQIKCALASLAWPVPAQTRPVKWG